ncbi:hypothetical protein PUN28_004929 [Cardiocondyla obscurior]|uniref:Uncharacterized protein n=1 Tax=Cardiocondyla obscurior TaxID=286306 RepID=A0AAW2GG69_9HYME
MREMWKDEALSDFNPGGIAESGHWPRPEPRVAHTTPPTSLSAPFPVRLLVTTFSQVNVVMRASDGEEQTRRSIFFHPKRSRILRGRAKTEVLKATPISRASGLPFR